MKKELDLKNFHQQLIITGMIGLVEDEGYTPHEVFELLEEMKKQTFHALSDISRGEG